jgi:ribosomal-protein-alanine N-acetyltransferase
MVPKRSNRSPPLFIRLATAADIPAILPLASESSSAGLWSAGLYQRIFTDSTPRRVALVGEEGSAVQAFLVASVFDREREIENIVVAESVRRQGFGKQLLDEFLRLCQKEAAKMIFLEVRESNLAARKLYEKCGFVANGRRPRYYPQPEEDAILYQMVLP